MVFYFSGTGNSLWIANEVSKYQDEQLISIGEEMQKEHNSFEYVLNENEKIGFIFPIYSWAPPTVVLDFIKKMNLVGYSNHYMFFICSCGDDIGLTQKILTKPISQKGWKLNSGFSVIMPNNYVSFPGFDVDSKELEAMKLEEAVITVEHINKMLADRCSDVFECTIGGLPFLKSRIINYIFNQYGVTAKPFKVTNDCIGCKLCQKACPMGNIHVDKKPIWGKNCTTCLACYHICPKNAIQYGNATKKKHQYFNPNIKVK